MEGLTSPELITREVLYLNDEIGTFSIAENQEGILNVTVGNKEGQTVILNSLLPEGWKIVGTKTRSPKYSEYRQFDPLGSFLDNTNKVVIAGERDIAKEQWKYLLILLHEFGHADRYLKDPTIRQRMKEADEKVYLIKSTTPPVDDYLTSERLTAEDERSAWAYSLGQYRKLMTELGLPKEKIFPTSADLKEWMYRGSLQAKAEWQCNRIIEKFSLPDEEKIKLIDQVMEMYTGKAS